MSRDSIVGEGAIAEGWRSGEWDYISRIRFNQLINQIHKAGGGGGGGGGGGEGVCVCVLFYCGVP